MHILLNGEIKVVSPGITVAALLHELGLLGKRLAVERNGEIVPKSLHETTQLVESDTIEIVIAVGGG